MPNKKSQEIADLIHDENFDISYEELYQLSNQTGKIMINHLKNISNPPIFPKKTLQEMKNIIHEPLPQKEQNLQQIIDDLQKKIITNVVRIGNPQLLGWIVSSGTAIGAFADGITSTINQNVSISGSTMATAVELLVIDWIKEILGYQKNAAGLLVSGGSMANLLALTVARNIHAGFNVRLHGMTNSKNMILYTSEETHVSIIKAAEILGIGSNNICYVKVDENLCLDVQDLKTKIIEDKNSDKHPFAVVATAGTVNTGAIDPLASIATICKKNNLWFHIDAAYGGFAVLSPKYKALLNGISHADSLAINPHKWLFIPYEAGCILVKNPKHLKDTYAITTNYLHLNKKNITSNDDVDFADYGIQLSRSFRALKIWMSLKQYGTKKYGRLIEQNIHLAQYCAALIEESADFTLTAPVNLSIVCFQYCPQDLHQILQETNQAHQKKINTYLNQLNQAIVASMRTDGRILLSSTQLKNVFTLRACIVNYRTTKQDIQNIIHIIRELGTAADTKLRKKNL